MNKKSIGIIIAALVIVGGVYLFNQSPKNNTNTPTSTGNNTGSNPTASATGRVVFAVSDAAMDMSAISQINMTVTGIDIHSQASGWVKVSGAAQTYNLLDLNAKNESKVFSDFQAPVGTYDMMRLEVSKIVIVTKAGAAKEAKLPSGELKINTTLVVKDGGTSSVNFDFLASKSLHMTGNGGYIFAPVVRTETKSDASVTVDTDSTVKVDGGHVDKDETDGMDIDGSVKANFEIKADEQLDVENDVIKVRGLLND
jgi:hypothetical protein